MKHIKDILKQSILFENLSDDEIKDVIEYSKSNIITLKKEEYLFYQDDKPRNLYIILEGVVQIEKIDTNGKRMIMNRFDEIGTMFAEVYIFFEGKLYDYSCLCIKDVKLFAMPKEFFLNIDDLTKTYKYKLVQNMLKILSQKAFYLNQKVLILSSFTLKQKIASYLLQKMKQQGKKDMQKVNLIFKREELADFIGTTRPSLSRELLIMQDDGIIDLEKNTFTVLDMKKLQEIL